MFIKQPIDITVVSGTSVTIIIPEIDLVNGRVDVLKFCLTKTQLAQLRTATGIETVSIQVGVSGTPLPLLTRLGNIFYADRLRQCFEYRIAYGNNGPSSTQHFINLNTPKPYKGYDPGSAPPAP